MRTLFFLMLFLFPSLFCAQEFTVNLKDPEYRAGVISTDQGGVITSPDLRVQARHIVYTNKTEKGQPVQRIVAEGDLMVESGGKTFVGRRLEYDFITKTGVVHEGVTAIDLWFLGGEQIRINPDRSVYFSNAFVTTSESKQADWKVRAQEGTLTNRSLLRAKNVTFRFFDAPILYLPSFKSNLRVFTESPVRYRVDWDKGLWPKISMRYRLYSWENLDLYFRINVRPSKGVGGALETDYRSPTKRATFRTRSYLDHDAFYRDTNPDKAHTHYRLEGRYDASSEDGRSTFLATYDWLSDKNLQTDFRSEDFELRTAKQTRIAFRNRQDWMRYGLDGKFRVNGFQGMMQELPFTFWAPKPITLGESGITFENRLTGGYLDYVSARKIEPLVPDFSAVRLSSQHTLYRPFFRRGIAFTPYLGVEGVFYSDSQQSRAEFLGVLTYGARLEGTMQREFKTLRHIFIPYIRYEGMTHPTISPDTPYVFSIQDGFNRLNLVQPGVRNLFFLRGSSLYHPNIIFDLSAYSFFGDNTFLKTVPKLQGELNWNFPTWTLSSKLGWNFEKALLDYANVGLAWTINEHFAFKTEFRHRSRYDWRKNQPHNYIMEITRDLSDLLNSPLSDGRNTLLSRLQVKIAPQWIARIESHIGWGRGGEPNYNEVKLDLITIISTSWRLRLTFIHSPAPHKKNDRFTFGISLVRN